MDLKNSSISEVKGLDLSGTVFKKNKEALPLKEGLRLDGHGPMAPGISYYLVFHRGYEPKSAPDSLIITNLGDVGLWEAWEIQLPKKVDPTARDWIANLGHTIN